DPEAAGTGLLAGRAEERRDGGQTGVGAGLLRLEGVGQRAERAAGVSLPAAAGQEDEAPLPGLGRGRVQEARPADAGLALDRHHANLAGGDGGQVLAERLQLGLPAERRAAVVWLLHESSPPLLTGGGTGPYRHTTALSSQPVTGPRPGASGGQWA